ncbi:MAG TPA: hypothetical protein VKY89_14925 [Thermoanaerobaculia bacterium]|jgi:hypothetical protein|nr:hypothetical protein [Thermoanaerobaculia bacterium]
MRASAAMSAGLAAVLMTALPVAGCRQADDRRAIQERLRAKGAAEVVREAAAARYTPPASGCLADAQVRMYLMVRERESRIREAAIVEAQRPRDAAAGVAPLGAAADLRAAQELKVNPKEYAWVRDQVLAAEAAATNQALYQKMAAGREQLLARMRRDRDALTDPVQHATAERELEDWKRGLQAAEPPMTPAIRKNVALLAHYRGPLARLRALEERALAAAAGVEAPPGNVAAAGQ